MVPIRVLVVDDFEPWRRKICGILNKHPDLHVVGEAADGVDAVHKARDLKPDLILLDIGLPKVDGIKAARRIFEFSPASRIVFVSQENHADVIRVALETGASAYVHKLNTPNKLLTVIAAVLGQEPTVIRKFDERARRSSTQSVNV
jgi:DNA-binding NarL/FixJ family response regulator